MTRAVLFDLGNTLVGYYTHEQWPGVLAESIAEAAAFLREGGRLRVPEADLPARAEAERGGSPDERVKPLEGRLERIFALEPGDLDEQAMRGLCQRFLAPTFARAVLYDDVLPTLAEIRRRGLRTGILSNTPWGSPGWLWREELARHGLDAAVDAAAFCVEAGYRKPARQAFEHILGLLGLSPEDCLFVGDDPRWDIAGPAGIGMAAVLIDRAGSTGRADAVRDLAGVLSRLER